MRGLFVVLCSSWLPLRVPPATLCQPVSVSSSLKLHLILTITYYYTSYVARIHRRRVNPIAMNEIYLLRKQNNYLQPLPATGPSTQLCAYAMKSNTHILQYDVGGQHQQRHGRRTSTNARTLTQSINQHPQDSRAAQEHTSSHISASLHGAANPASRAVHLISNAHDKTAHPPKYTPMYSRKETPIRGI